MAIMGFLYFPFSTKKLEALNFSKLAILRSLVISSQSMIEFNMGELMTLFDIIHLNSFHRSSGQRKLYVSSFIACKVLSNTTTALSLIIMKYETVHENPDK